MTWAQGTFAFCFVVLPAATGLLLGARLRREGRSLVMGWAAGFGIIVLVLLACCWIAHSCFPRYPHQQVPELLANAFTLPVLAAAVGVIWLVPARQSQSLKFCRLATIALIVVYAGGVILCPQLFTWGFRKALPWSARDIHELIDTDYLLPDYGYGLKAKISEPQFRQYVAEFGLTPHTPDRNYSEDKSSLNWKNISSFQGTWWDPSDSLDTTYVWQGGTTWTFAKYERGYLYLASTRH